MSLKRLAFDRTFLLRLTGAAAVACLSGCAVLHRGFLDAQGPVAAGERNLYWKVVAVMAFVIAPVLVLAPAFAWHYRLGNRHHAFRPKWNFSWTLEFLIWVPPLLIVAGLGIWLWHSAREFDPYTPLRGAAPPLEVQAVAFDWKWLFIYPESGVAALNELAIPVGRSVHVTLTSATVMQSMFIPLLAGQIYAMGGMTTQLNLAADRTGIFSGENTQYNGPGYAAEHFAVDALPAADFDRWIQALRASRNTLDGAELARLGAPGIEPKPAYFAHTPPGLFDHILASVRAGTPLGKALR